MIRVIQEGNKIIIEIYDTRKVEILKKEKGPPPDSPLAEYAYHIVRELLSYGLTQKEIAKRIGVSKITVGLWASGQGTPLKINLHKLQNLLKEVKDGVSRQD